MNFLLFGVDVPTVQGRQEGSDCQIRLRIRLHVRWQLSPPLSREYLRIGGLGYI